MHPEWLLVFDQIVADSTAGLPQDPSVKWTYLSPRQIVERFLEKSITVSRYHVVQMLEKRNYRSRNTLKKNTLKQVEYRNEQFEKIAQYRSQFAEQGLPILSIDTKKKEMLGNFARSGKAYATAERCVNDHDFLSFSEGQIVPHGIYDISDNTGYITLGTSKDTSEFVCDNIKKCWLEHLQFKYPNATTLLLLCDGGGSNASAHYIVKQDLVNLSNALNISILVAHYPPYCSKWNWIEHKVFSQITLTWSRTPLYNLEFVKKITDTTTTKTGLVIKTSINDKIYLNKRPVNTEFKDNIQYWITFDDKLPKWNYLIKPVNPHVIF